MPFKSYFLWKKNIGLPFHMSDIQRVFPAIFGVGSNNQDSECMWNWPGRFFAAVFVPMLFAAVFLF